MNRPAFLTSEGSLRKFDLVTANPMWNQDFSQATYENDSYNRFNFGYPPSNSADWGWIQHMFASLNDGGKMAMVIDTGAVSRGSGNVGKNRERNIRKQFVEKDFVEAVLLLPENMFYNTTAPGIIIVLNKSKPIERRGQVLLINATKLFKKGRPKNYLPDESIKQIPGIYLGSPLCLLGSVPPCCCISGCSVPLCTLSGCIVLGVTPCTFPCTFPVCTPGCFPCLSFCAPGCLLSSVFVLNDGFGFFSSRAQSNTI